MGFREKASASNGGLPLRASAVEVIQANVGYRCNMACKHCHVCAGPRREEAMGEETAEEVLSALERNPGVRVLDITGGAPELNPRLGRLVSGARALGRGVIVRSNLTVFFEEAVGGWPGFYAENSVEVVASLPYYLEDSVDRVRGDGAFEKSIRALRLLNSLGYGRGALRLSLVYNSQGAFLPPGQARLEEDYRKELGERYGVAFDALYAFANMPVGRFREFLLRTGRLAAYMGRLEAAFNPETLGGLMCRRLVNVGWDGALYDCDFNQALGLPVSAGPPARIADFDYEALYGREIAVGEHCFGCTAGQGST